MKSSPKALPLSEEQVLHFRALRGYLAGKGASTPVEAVRTLVGTQSQQLAPGLLALSQRMASKPTAAELEEHLFAPERDLVRTWGQRDTIHIYDAEDTWARVMAALRLWSGGGRRGPQPSQKSQKAALKVALGQGEILKKDLRHLVEPGYLDELDDRIGTQEAKITFATGRLVWRLSQEGHLCQGPKLGARQTYATRQSYYPDLIWPDHGGDAFESCLELTRRYLGVNAPATVQDVAHFFGAKVSECRRWVEKLKEGGELIEVQCGSRPSLVALACDEKALRKKPGPWPVRLLPLWDTLLMSHKDKSWTVPREEERPLIWKKAAMVVSVVLARGKVVAVWSMKRKGKRLDFEVQPLCGWRKTTMAKEFRRETEIVAQHLQLEPGPIQW